MRAEIDILDAIPTFDALRERWVIEQKEMRAYLDTLTEETLNGMIRYTVQGNNFTRSHVVGCAQVESED